MTKQLIALVATAVMVEGVRTVIQPGERLPALAPHDEAALVNSGAAKNPEAEDAAKLLAEEAEKAGQAEFQAARDAVIAEQASIGDPASDTPTADAPTPAAKTPAAKKR